MKKSIVTVAALATAFALLCAGCGDNQGEESPTAAQTPGSELLLSNAELELLAEYGRYLTSDDAYQPGVAIYDAAAIDFMATYFAARLEEYEDGYGRVSRADANALMEAVFGLPLYEYGIGDEPGGDVYASDEYFFVRLDIPQPDCTLEFVSQEVAANDSDEEESYAVNVLFNIYDGSGATLLGSVRFTVLSIESGNGFTINAHTLLSSTM
ncbi:MAG: hypothetical protein Q4B99_00320 [Clostridia bacterium]|nr:hypothetical protein [Clostridia bacterium]